MEPVLEGTNREKLWDLVDMAQLALQKYLYRKTYRYNEIVAYDYNSHRRVIKNMPSMNYFRKIGKYVPQNEVEDMKKLFGRGILMAVERCV